MNILISVWGKNGSGKSAVASNLACAFARLGNAVALVGANRFYGAIQYMFGMEVPPERSLRATLTGGDSISAQGCFQECPAVKNLYVASLADGDDCAGYRKARAETVARFINLTKKSFDVSIFDCDESTEDPLSMYSLTLSEKILYVARPSIRHALFARAHESVVGGLQIKERMRALLISPGAGDVVGLGASGVLHGAGGAAASYVPTGLNGRCSALTYYKDSDERQGEFSPVPLQKNASRQAVHYYKEVSALAELLVAELAEQPE